MKFYFLVAFFLAYLSFKSNFYSASISENTTDGIVFKPQISKSIIWTIDWSPDDKYVAFGGDDSVLNIYKAPAFTFYKSLKMKSGILNVSWHPQGKLLAIAGMNEIQILNMETDQIIPISELKTGGRGIGWNYSGELLALADFYGVVQILNKEGKLIRSIKKNDSKSYFSLDWHPSKNLIAVGGDEIILFDTSGKQLKLIHNRKENTGVLAVRWHPGGEFFASGDYGHEEEGVPTLLQLWKEDGRLVKTVLGSKAEYRNIRWNNDGSLLATASDALRIWTKEGQMVHSSPSSDDLLWGVDWNSKCDLLVTTSIKGNVTLWKSDAKMLKAIK